MERKSINLVLSLAFSFTLFSCVFEYDSQDENSDSTAQVPPRPQKDTPGSYIDSTDIDSTPIFKDTTPSTDTLPTWPVPFVLSVSKTAKNPFGQPPDPVLAALGTQTLAKIISASDWDVLFPRRAGVHRLCDGQTDFYTHAALLEAAKDFPAFAAEGPDTVRRREVAAFLAQIAHETTGGSGSYAAGADRYQWGLCWTEEIGYTDLSLAYRKTNALWPPSPGKSYHGRGPIQLTWNTNYGQAGDDLGIPLLAQPELVLATGANAFRTALWFWMKEQYPKPSPHSAIVETWAPSASDKRNNRWPGFGVTTNIINGGGECGDGSENHPGPKDRMGFFSRFTTYIRVDTGRNVACYEQHDFSFQ